MPTLPQLPTSRLARFALACFVCFAGLIGFFLLRSGSSVVSSPQMEMLGHVGASGGLTLSAIGVWLALDNKLPTMLQVLMAGAVATLVFEFAQGLVPARVVELQDILVGFGGVLIAATVIGLIFERLPARALQAHTALAAVGCLALIGLLVFEAGPQPADSAAPDGDTCPLTMVTGDRGERIAIGAEPGVENGCFLTEHGGFGLFSDNGRLGGEAVLVSSPLEELLERVANTESLSIRAQIQTPPFEDEVPPPSVITSIRMEDGRELAHLRARRERVNLAAPGLNEQLRSSTFTTGLPLDSVVTIEARYEADRMLILIDDEIVSDNTINPGWVDEIRLAAAAGEGLTIYIANAPHGRWPFQGTIDWVEFEAGTPSG